jgi:hypothetical protein
MAANNNPLFVICGERIFQTTRLANVRKHLAELPMTALGCHSQVNIFPVSSQLSWETETGSPETPSTAK